MLNRSLLSAFMLYVDGTKLHSDFCCFYAGGLGTGSLTGMSTGGLGLPAVNTDPFGQRKLSTSGLSQPTFQQSKFC